MSTNMNITVPLKDLDLSPLNTRKTPPGDAEQAELAASIVAHGLLENLVVRPCGDERYEVLAGERRLLVMRELAREGELDTDYPVACLVHEGDPAEVSLAENVVRLPMHALDQFEAFAGLADQGLSAAEIAGRFGNTETLVRQRLRLGRVAPEIREAYRADDISLEVLMAFAVTEDQGQQLAVWNETRDGYIHARQVRNMLTDGKLAASSGFARFAGREAYEAAGGTFTRDLFSEGEDACWLDDRALVMRLCQEKLSGAGEELQASEGWKWVQAAPEIPFEDMQKYTYVYPQSLDPTPEQTAELDRLRDAMELYEGTDPDPEEEQKLMALEEQYEALEDSLRAYAPEDLERAGCVVTIRHDGGLNIRRGLVRPEDQAKKTTSASSGAKTGSGSSGSTEEPSGYSARLLGDLGNIRLGIAQKYLAEDFGCAFDVMLFTMARSMAHATERTGYISDGPLDVTLRTTLPRGQGEHPVVTTPDLPAGIDTRWLELPPEEGFRALSAMAEHDKQRLFAWCVALTLEGGLADAESDDTLHEAIGKRLGIDVAAHWRPDGETFFSRITKPCALGVAADVLGKTWARDHKNEKKAALSEALEANFGGERTPGVTPEQADRALKWLPDGMAYGNAPADATGSGATHTGERAFWPKTLRVAHLWNRKNGAEEQAAVQ